MRIPPRPSPSRERLVLAVGWGAGVALLWAGVTVHGGLRSAGEIAAARLSAAVEETVRLEWSRLLRAEEWPVAPAGDVFHWDASLALEGAASPPSAPVRPFSALRTLLAEAERRELVERDPSAALELVLEACARFPEDEAWPEAELRALQLAASLEREEVAEKSWKRLAELPLECECEGPALLDWPCRLLAWLGLPSALRARIGASGIASADLAGLAEAQDRLVLGPPEDPVARFEPAPVLALVCARLDVPCPPLERRAAAALARLAPLPAPVEEARWHFTTLLGRPFVTRRLGTEHSGAFYGSSALAQALAERAGLPAGFQLDLEGERVELGTALRPRVALSESTLAFTLRHADPGSLGRAEGSRLRLLRGALVALALGAVAGGSLLARLLARERRLGELKSAFVAGVSHDLRTPLASIQLLVENLESGAAGKDPARTHRALRKETSRLRRLVEDVLDFSRLERGHGTPLEREDVDLARFTGELEAEFRARCEAAARPLAFSASALPPSAVFDAHAVRRALENLLDNALKHGHGTVRLGCEAAGATLRFSLTDEGSGVATEDRERAFDAFERLSAAEGHVGGTGLGLAIVRAIARGHGGEARIRGREGGAGCVFEFDLPLEPAA